MPKTITGGRATINPLNLSVLTEIDVYMINKQQTVYIRSMKYEENIYKKLVMSIRLGALETSV